MVLPVTTFTDPTLSQPIRQAPWLTGMQTGVGLAGQLQKMQEESKMAPLKRQLTQEQAHQAASESAFNQARAKGLPLEDAIKAAQLAETSSRFGPAYTFARMLMAKPVAQRGIWFAQHPGQSKALLDILGQKVLTQNQQSQQRQTGAMGVVNQMLAQRYPGMYAAPPGGAAPGAAPGGGPGLAPAQPQPTGTPQTPQTPQTMQTTQPGAQPGAQPTQAGAPAQQLLTGIPDVTQWKNIPEPIIKNRLSEIEQTQFSANKGNTSGPSWERATASSGAEYMLTQNRDKYVKMFDLASQYSGALGRGKQFFNQWANRNPNAVEAYRAYNRSFVPALKNIVKRIEGMGATDQQRGELEKMVNQIDDVKGNPMQAKRGMNNTVAILHDIASSNYRDAEPGVTGLFAKMAGQRNWEDGNYLGLPKGQKGILTAGRKGATADLDKMNPSQLLKLYREAK